MMTAIVELNATQIHPFLIKCLNGLADRSRLVSFQFTDRESLINDARPTDASDLAFIICLFGSTVHLFYSLLLL
jgi:hypothetical protein